MFAPGAFAGSVERFDIRAYVNHRCGRDITTSLSMQESHAGLFFAGVVDSEDWAGILLTAEHNRRLHGVSIGWTDLESTKCETTGIKTITAARLEEISLILGDKTPAFPNTWVTLEYVE